MSLGDPNSSEVVAMQFDEPAVATELASWCGGEVEELTNPEDSTDTRVVIWVPGRRGPRPARLGDWIVRHGDGDFRVRSPEDFAARYEPLG